jgi:flavin reductase (DIM6/NTAB) family NADH-FMN oxidoreductase RutF
MTLEAADTLDEQRFVGPIEAPAFKKLMRAVASGVSVVTTFHHGSPHGMTATAFSSVSADPPTVLIVLNKGTRSHPLITASGHFVVNMLRDDQSDLGTLFSGKVEDQFSGVGYHRGQLGAPILDGVVSWFECETVNEVDAGTHTIFVGRVVAGAADETSPLLYHGGQYKALIASQPST